MIRIYCDTNIFQYLKPKHPKFTFELLEAFENLKDKMLFTYSDAHLDDLRSSQREYIEEDLKLMEHYVKDNYFMHDFIKERGTGPYLATPLEAFESKDYKTYDEVLKNPFEFDDLMNGLDEFEEGKTIKNILKSLLNTPMLAFGNNMNPSNMDEPNRVWFNKAFPSYSPMMGVGDFMNSIWPFTYTLFKDKREVAELRRYISSYMNRDNYSFDKWGMEFNEKLKNSVLGKSFIDVVEGMLTNNQKGNLYHKFIYAYGLLEMYNITQERSSRGSNKTSIKKFTLESLNTDAQHAWYGSFSDYFVTDDKGIQVKASIVYQLLELPTRVLSSSDFTSIKTFLLGQEETYHKFSTSFAFDLKNSFQLYDKTNLATQERAVTYKPTHYYFNYFNRFQIITYETSTLCAFYCDRHSHASFFMFREIELIIAKTLKMFGIDDENKGNYNIYEKHEAEETIRKWSFENAQYSIITVSKSWGSSVCLCLRFDNLQTI